MNKEPEPRENHTQSISATLTRDITMDMRIGNVSSYWNHFQHENSEYVPPAKYGSTFYPLAWVSNPHLAASQA